MPKTTKKRKKVAVKRSYSKRSAVVVALLFAVIGATLIYRSFAISSNTVSFENGDTSKCSLGINEQNATLKPTTAKAYEGSYSAVANYGDHSGGAVNAYARCIVEVSWGTGDDVWYGGAFFLPAGFATGASPSLQGQIDIMRWDNYSLKSTSQDWGGIIIQNSDKLARLKRFNVSSDYTDLSPSFKIPENRWVWIEVHQKFSPLEGQAINEVYMDGVLQGSSKTANTYHDSAVADPSIGRKITRIRYGLVGIDSSKQQKPLELWVDRATISNSKIGPLGGVTTNPDTTPTDTGTTNPPPSDTTAPSAPSGLTAAAVTDTQVNLKWLASSDNVGVKSYKIYRNGTFIASVASSQLSYTNTGLNANTAYTYQVGAIDAAANESARSAAASATTPVTTSTTTGAVAEGEQFTYNTSFAKILYDAKASKGKELRFGSNGTASIQMQTGASSKAVMRVRSWACSAKPNLVLAVDGKQVSSTSLSRSTFYDVSVPLSISPGTHKIAVSLSNGRYTSSNCGNSIHFDKITLQ